MYRLLIVDDEKEIRDGIAESIPWREMGIDSVYQADNGAAALEIYKKHHPELIITDIRMPGTDGLEFMENLQREESQAKVVFISGYDDFQYARKAMQLKAWDYLLKPVKTAELTTTVMKMIHELERETKEHDDAWMNVLPVLQGKFVESLLTNKAYYNEALFKEKCKQLKLEWLDYLPLIVCVIEPDHYSRVAPSKKEQELLSFTIDNVLKDITRKYGEALVWPFDKSSWVVIIGLSSHNDNHYELMEHILSINEDMLSDISYYTKTSVSAGVSSVSTEWSLLPQLLEQSLKALTNRQFTGGNKVHVYESTPGVLQDDGDTFDEFAFLNGLRNGNAKDVRAALSGLPKLMLTFPAGADGTVSRPCFEWVLSIHRLLEQANLLTFSATESFRLWQTIEQIETIDALKEILTEHFVSLCRQTAPSIGGILQKALDYIQANIRDKITLEDVASHVYISPIWLSRLFRQKMDRTFLNYVTMLKIEEAKTLLAQDVKVNEVASLLGYQDFAHFSKIFKRFAGCNPSEFRKQGLERTLP
ncbi:response regulator transcription factor [Paenibacillus eucommiae]|uniref:Two-component system response regulator YesN n=1 Tax=Paenibacillus eucommiae TaxID=1355755 RepID=A0ABS4J9J2_9BACL|nr:response regulator [Paenibacillus eucommiae]MBP1995741.1 two-component system response regulator YesN [Paenibacillus eucommiae]